MDKWAVLGQARRVADPRWAANPGSTQSVPGSTQPLPDFTQSLLASTQSVPDSTQPLPTQSLPASTQSLLASTQPLPEHVRFNKSKSPFASLTNLWWNYIHGLSQIDYHHGSGRAWSQASQSDRGHVASLDGLALLLVFGPSGDVAAISSWRSAYELKLLWAKNKPVDDNSKELSYVEELLENAKKGTPAYEMLLKIVIPMCRDKIFHRVKKLAKSFGVSQTNQRQEDSNLWQFDETEEPCQSLKATLEEAGRLKDNESIIDLLDGFTRFVGRITKTSKAEDFWSILYFSWYVASVAGLNKILEEDQVRYLSKLGDYVVILERIPSLLEKLGKVKITVEQVLPPAAAGVEVSSGSLEILSLRYSKIVSDNLKEPENWDLVKKAYKDASPGDPVVGKKTITFTQHCEITLALDALKRIHPGLTNTKIEIGVSKACCEWCCQYLNLLASAYPQHSILVRASHGKQPDGWMIPPSGPMSATQQMIRVIEDKVDNVIWAIDRNRRSDSNKLPSFEKKVKVGTRAPAMEQIMVDFSK